MEKKQRALEIVVKIVVAALTALFGRLQGLVILHIFVDNFILCFAYCTLVISKVAV